MTRKSFLVSILLLAAILILPSCGGGMGGFYGGYTPNEEYINGEEYNEIQERGFVDPSINPLSNFSLDSSSYAYSNIRRLILDGNTVEQDAVVIEQMLNYFNYSYKNDTDEALSSSLEMAICPWNINHYLAAISVNAKEIEMQDSKNNFVFLIDTSGSMSSYNKLGLFQDSFRLLANSIGENDTISIVTYASGVRVVADGVNGSNKLELVEAVDSLMAGGSTNGSGGIQKAYEIAQKHFITDGNNRILLATDGDFNVGIYNDGQLNDFISSKRKSGVYLSVLGYGIGNTQHDTMELLAKNGNGNAYYIDSLLEARKVFVSELGSVLNTVAKDSKIQVEFNPNNVVKYRLLGYENSMLTNDQFEDVNTDAGEIGAGHTTIAMYEIELKSDLVEEYIFKTKLRYKEPSNDNQKEIVNEMFDITPQPSNDFKFAAAVVEFGLILRNSTYKGNSSYEHLLSILNDTSLLNDEYKIEFKTLVEKAKRIYLSNKEYLYY